MFEECPRVISRPITGAQLVSKQPHRDVENFGSWKMVYFGSIGARNARIAGNPSRGRKTNGFYRVRSSSFVTRHSAVRLRNVAAREGVQPVQLGV